MTLALVSVALLITPLQPEPPEPQWPQRKHVEVQYGLFSQYAKGPTDSQIWYHEEVTGLLSDYENYDGFVAVVDCSLVGEAAWISIDGSPWEHVFIGDCSGHVSTTTWMKRAGILAEIDWYLKEKHGVPDLKAVPGKMAWQHPRPYLLATKAFARRAEPIPR